ncbi:HlyD family efflux transporter periplasmic adaptor subunit [Lacrimispora sp. NSJ-141]|uniref:HlyD family efflux transporter periplasmic adaptor subunit n=1 Tax=Lientehia hominis TaxID=2897778 RepID=A0AAP2RLH2_9FIRM|nr:HlyD family efflux transporter periplasmic adaptor subunit [Lientehia hominis]MCD2493208.1 HlyD family efflux transporter periplasmic adaptor subunit [Lientehia hominis]
MRSSRKKLIIILVSVLLVVVLACGGIFYAVKHSGKPVQVAPASAMNQGYWDNNSDISPYGNVTTNMNQEIRYDESLIITKIYVKEGDTVKTGDPLIAYDTSLVSLELEMKQMQIDGIGLNIQNVQAELDQLRKTKPVAFASPSPLAGMALASSATDPTSPTDPTEPSSSPEPLQGSVYGSVTPESIPYKGTGTAEDPYRYYVFPENGKASVSISREYLKKALGEKTVSVFDTVDDGKLPTKIVSSWEMNFETITELVQPSIGTEFPEELHGQTIYDEITAESIPYNAETADGSEASPYRFLCAPGASADASFLSAALENQTVSIFDVVDNVDNPTRILYFWTLNGKNLNPDEPEDPDIPDDPGFDGPDIDIPDINVPTGPTKEELQKQIKEKEEALKSLSLDKRTAELELKQLQKKMDDGVITSTVDGTVKSVLDEETAKLESSPLITVTGEEGFYITGSVAETSLEKIAKGMSVSVTSWNSGMTYDAAITSVSNSPASGNGYGNGNPNMSYYPFTAVIKGDAELQNGEGVDLSVEGMGTPSFEDVLYLSQAFVREEGNQYYVYKKGEDGLLTKQYIEAGKIVYGSIEIKSGLNMEDEIAFPYGKDVKEGAKTESVDSLYNYGM